MEMENELKNLDIEKIIKWLIIAAVAIFAIMAFGPILKALVAVVVIAAVIGLVAGFID